VPSQREVTDPVGHLATVRLVHTDPAVRRQAALVVAGHALQQDQPIAWLTEMLDALGLLDPDLGRIPVLVDIVAEAVQRIRTTPPADNGQWLDEHLRDDDLHRLFWIAAAAIPADRDLVELLAWVDRPEVPDRTQVHAQREVAA
jgi:hypothetical protein